MTEKSEKAGSVPLGSQGIEQKVMTLVSPLCQSLGCEIIDVEWRKEGGQWLLRLFVDHPAGVDLDLCSSVSNAVGDALDLADFIAENYMLEVSSPGINRPLKKPKDFQRFAGEKCQIKLYAANADKHDGKKQFVGKLLGFSEKGVGIVCEKSAKEYYFALTEISKANLKPDLKF